MRAVVKLNFVYLRPSQLVGFRKVGPYQETAGQAWSLMFDWLDTVETDHRARIVVRADRDRFMSMLASALAG